MHGVHVGREGRVIVRAADKGEAARIAGALKEVEVVSVGKKLPKVIILGVPADLATEDPIIREAAGVEAPEHFHIVRCTTPRGGIRCNGEPNSGGGSGDPEEAGGPGPHIRGAQVLPGPRGRRHWSVPPMRQVWPSGRGLRGRGKALLAMRAAGARDPCVQRGR